MKSSTYSSTSSNHIVLCKTHQELSEMVGLDSLCRGLIAKYPSAKLAFVTPWRVPGQAFEAVTSVIKKVCGNYSIPVFDASSSSGIYVWDETFRKLYFQGPNDMAHLNAKGHQLFFRKGEIFLLGL